jgi:RHS repeat-associated protein
VVGSVRLRTQDYDTQGNVYQMTAYADTGGLTLVNQMQDAYNGLGQLTDVYQANSGAVDTSTTPETQYAYSDPTSGSLMTAMTYPSGRVLDYGRDNNALDTAIGRVDYLADAGGSAAGHLVDYLRLGQGTIVQQADANGVKLTYLQQSGDTSAVTTGPQYAGDSITGLGRFGQVIDQNWVSTSTPTPTATDRFQYGYDQGGNVLYSDNLVNPGESELYHSNSTASGDDSSAYDPLDRLTAFERGTLSASENNSGVLDTVSSPTDSQDFALDAVGNQTAVTTNGTTVDNTSNSKNQLTANGSAGLTYDDDGNTLTDQSGQQYVFDAWNHIAAAKNSSGTTIATYTFAGNGDRLTETADGTTTGFYYNGPQVIETRQGSTVTTQNVFNIDYVNDLLLRDDNSTSGSLGRSGSGLGQRLFAQHDANFNVTALTSATGTVLERYEYSPYGTVTVLNPDGTVRGDGTIASSEYGVLSLFQGMRLDPVTGLYETPNRELNPVTGTWLQADPAGYVNGASTYQAEGSDPVRLVDPGGEFSILPGAGTVGGGLLGGIVGGASYLVGSALSNNDVTAGGFWGSVAGGAATGAVIGSFADAVTGDPLGMALLGGAAGALGGGVQSYVQQSIDGNGPVDGSAVVQSMAIGGATGFVTGGLSGALSSGGPAAATVGGSLVTGALGVSATSGATIGVTSGLNALMSVGKGKSTGGKCGSGASGKPSPGVGSSSLVDQLKWPKDAQRALLRDALKSSGAGKVAHHIIPLQAETEYEALLRKAALGGFDINGANNGILLDEADHVYGHPVYNQEMLDALNRVPDNLSPADTAKSLQNISDQMRKAINAGTYGPWGMGCQGGGPAQGFLS